LTSRGRFSTSSWIGGSSADPGDGPTLRSSRSFSSFPNQPGPTCATLDRNRLDFLSYESAQWAAITWFW